jgi:large subunit ribosomal protein L29
MTKPSELKELSDEALKNKEEDTREELFNLRLQIATQQTTNVARVKSLRKDLARILTILEERYSREKEQ